MSVFFSDIVAPSPDEFCLRRVFDDPNDFMFRRYVDAFKMSVYAAPYEYRLFLEKEIWDILRWRYRDDNVSLLDIFDDLHWSLRDFDASLEQNFKASGLVADLMLPSAFRQLCTVDQSRFVHAFLAASASMRHADPENKALPFGTNARSFEELASEWRRLVGEQSALEKPLVQSGTEWPPATDPGLDALKLTPMDFELFDFVYSGGSSSPGPNPVHELADNMGEVLQMTPPSFWNHAPASPAAASPTASYRVAAYDPAAKQPTVVTGLKRPLPESQLFGTDVFVRAVKKLRTRGPPTGPRLIGIAFEGRQLRRKDVGGPELFAGVLDHSIGQPLKDAIDAFVREAEQAVANVPHARRQLWYLATLGQLFGIAASPLASGGGGDGEETEDAAPVDEEEMAPKQRLTYLSDRINAFALGIIERGNIKLAELSGPEAEVMRLFREEASSLWEKFAEDDALRAFNVQTTDVLFYAVGQMHTVGGNGHLRHRVEVENPVPAHLKPGGGLSTMSAVVWPLLGVAERSLSDYLANLGSEASRAMVVHGEIAGRLLPTLQREGLSAMESTSDVTDDSADPNQLCLAFRDMGKQRVTELVKRVNARFDAGRERRHRRIGGRLLYRLLGIKAGLELAMQTTYQAAFDAKHSELDGRDTYEMRQHFTQEFHTLYQVYVSVNTWLQASAPLPVKTAGVVAGLDAPLQRFNNVALVGDLHEQAYAWVVMNADYVAQTRMSFSQQWSAVLYPLLATPTGDQLTAVAQNARAASLALPYLRDAKGLWSSAADSLDPDHVLARLLHLVYTTVHWFVSFCHSSSIDFLFDAAQASAVETVDEGLERYFYSSTTASVPVAYPTARRPTMRASEPHLGALVVRDECPDSWQDAFWTTEEAMAFLSADGMRLPHAGPLYDEALDLCYFRPTPASIPGQRPKLAEHFYRLEPHSPVDKKRALVLLPTTGVGHALAFFMEAVYLENHGLADGLAHLGAQATQSRYAGAYAAELQFSADNLADAWKKSMDIVYNKMSALVGNVVV